MKIRASLLTLFILLGGFLLKIPALTQPLIGHFGSYQALNGMMAQMMLEDLPASLLIPRTFVLMEGQPSLHLVYYPFGSVAAALAKGSLGGVIDFWGRFQASIFFFLAGTLLFLAARKLLGTRPAILATLAFTFSPMALISGISFQNEASGIFFLVTSFWLLTFRSLSLSLAAGIFFSLALVARLHFIMALPGLALLCAQGRSPLKNLLLFFLATCLPIGAWLAFTFWLGERFPTQVMTSVFIQWGEGRIAATALFQSGDFYKRMMEIIFGRLVTPVLSPFLLFGLFIWKRERAPFLVWILGSLATVLVLPQKVADHPFYLISGLPAIAVILGVVLLDLSKKTNRTISIGLLAIFLMFSLRYFLPAAFSATPQEKQLPQIGRKVNALTKEGDFLIASQGPSPNLLYYTGRRGWAFDLEMEERPSDNHARHVRLRAKGYGDLIEWLDYLRSQGAQYLVITEPELFRSKNDFYAYVTNTFEPVEGAGDDFLMFALGGEGP